MLPEVEEGPPEDSFLGWLCCNIGLIQTLNRYVISELSVRNGTPSALQCPQTPSSRVAEPSIFFRALVNCLRRILVDTGRRPDSWQIPISSKLGSLLGSCLYGCRLLLGSENRDPNLEKYPNMVHFLSSPGGEIWAVLPNPAPACRKAAIITNSWIRACSSFLRSVEGPVDARLAQTNSQAGAGPQIKPPCLKAEHSAGPVLESSMHSQRVCGAEIC